MSFLFILFYEIYSSDTFEQLAKKKELQEFTDLNTSKCCEMNLHKGENIGNFSNKTPDKSQTSFHLRNCSFLEAKNINEVIPSRQEITKDSEIRGSEIRLPFCEEKNMITFREFIEVDINYSTTFNFINKCRESLITLARTNFSVDNAFDYKNKQFDARSYVDYVKYTLINLFFEQKTFNMLKTPINFEGDLHLRSEFKPLVVFLPETIVILIKILEDLNLKNFTQMYCARNAEARFLYLYELKGLFDEGLKNFIFSYKLLLKNCITVNKNITYNQKRQKLTSKEFEKFYSRYLVKQASFIWDFYLFLTYQFITDVYTRTYQQSIELIKNVCNNEDYSLYLFLKFSIFLVDESSFQKEKEPHSFPTLTLSQFYQHQNLFFICEGLLKFFTYINKNYALKWILNQKNHSEIFLTLENRDLYVLKRLNDIEYKGKFQLIDFAHYNLDIIISVILMD